MTGTDGTVSVDFNFAGTRREQADESVINIMIRSDLDGLSLIVCHIAKRLAG